MKQYRFLLYVVAISLAGCGSAPSSRLNYSKHEAAPIVPRSLDPRSEEAVLYALGLLDTGYRFGGRNPAAGLDCSGMVIYIYNEVADLKLGGSAADIAKRGHTVDPRTLLPGDLVFFNTMGRSYSHVGIYIGNNRFIHAPKSEGKIRIEQMNSSYFSSRFEEARTLFN